jgi:hypothetical protein
MANLSNFGIILVMIDTNAVVRTSLPGDLAVPNGIRAFLDTKSVLVSCFIFTALTEATSSP